jgi:tetratricopeptide (TPR) repeat protein
MSDAVARYKSFAAALLHAPDDPEMLVNQFALLSDDGDRANGKHYLYLAQRAYNAAPDNINAVFNYGSALQRAGEFGKAKDIYQWCVNHATEEWLTRCLHHLGVAYRALGQNVQAIELYDQAISRDPNPNYRKDRALAKMAAGRLREGLEEFECRREVAERRLAAQGGVLIAQQRLPEGVTHWKGEDLTGKTLVIYHEEGAGDFIQFCRFIPRLREAGVAKILLTGPAPDLLELISDQFAVDGIAPLSGPFECDFVVGSMSLPWRLGIDMKDVDGKPYMAAEPATFPRRGLLNVGLIWRGNPAYGMDVHRSMAFSALCPLFDLNDVAFYSLQVGPASAEFGKLGFDGFVADLAPFAKSWRATARLLKRLDAVVTVDTAVAHLSGALGVPALMMVTKASDWRWDRNSEKTVWYDSVRVYRQNDQDNWKPCVQQVRKQLTEMLGERRKDARDGARQDTGGDQPRPACHATA